ncbi:hypothetical protein HG537_0C01600 [Torulaspora globosa]|uniref:rRNA biogenesis protein RRP36 n=1 Tax=Torulaspora globosa TaxID=48254 RepID=A0A7H9HQE0_9SACH|nr:hypothetical protein HG537_0C01600 [Torulaspora sp. CBS 2947]
MSYYFKNIKPGIESEPEDDEELENLLRRNADNGQDEESSDDEMRTLSFGSLKKANDILSEEEESVEDEKEEESKRKREIDSDSGSGSDPESDSEDPGFFEEDSDDNYGSKRQKKKNKHAPTEQSSKKRVSKIRKIPGLEVPKVRNSNLYKDIRFDKATGQPMDSTAARQRYKFLDEYRENEIKELESLLKDRKFKSKVPQDELEEMEQQLKSMKSKLQTVKNKELERKIVKDYEKELNKDNKNKYHLKQNEKRKVIQKWKFDHMKAKQREKVMERKRKKRLGKEFKQFEFHKTR